VAVTSVDIHVTDEPALAEHARDFAAELKESLPKDFVFGTATSAYQIEGAVREDGRSESIWDRFCAVPGAVFNGDSGEIACDHYHRYPEDIAIIQAMGLRAYRFSIAWPRIIPNGDGVVNERGLDFYDRLVDSLLHVGVQPYVTLFHWDLPQALQDRGGWYSRDTAVVFGDYARVVVDRLGDRVRHWITHNEPWCSSWLGHGYGVHAPGLKDGDAGAVKAAHHILLSHGYAMEAIRAAAPEADAGITIDLYPMFPLHDSEADRGAARRADGQRNRWFLDPVLRGSYPEDMTALLELLPDSAQDDLPRIGAPIDFLGVNYYERQVIRSGPHGEPLQAPKEGPWADNGREIFPDGLRVTVKRLHEDYPIKKLYVTENGIGYHDVIGPDGRIHDSHRTQFLEQHLRAVAAACREDAPVSGYFAWSLMDNFEWSKGYDERERYGLVYVDRSSLERIPKSSGEWYGEVVRSFRS